jgi:hypothetical protein
MGGTLITLLDDATSENLLCAVAGRGREANVDAGGAGRDRAAAYLLRVVQRPCQPFLRDARAGGSMISRLAASFGK